MKYTLLELTQSVLRSIKGEAVTSISDTEESLAVADIVKECYYTIVSRMDLPETKDFYQLTASGDNTKPVIMTLPTAAITLEYIDYDQSAAGATNSIFTRLEYLTPSDFIAMQSQLTIASTVSEMTIPGTSVKVKYYNNRAPTYYTSQDDGTLIFDAYDSAVSTTLTAARSRAYGIYDTAWTSSDSFTPNLDGHQVQLLLKEAKAMAWLELKSEENGAAVRSARQLMISAKLKKDRANQKSMGYYRDWYPNYGRK